MLGKVKLMRPLLTSGEMLLKDWMMFGVVVAEVKMLEM
jgi:hypothetical protein